MTPEEAFQTLGQFPHCDPRVLHKPGDCEHCDTHPEWQAYRIAMGINFTGEKTATIICPSEHLRPAHVINRWHGNRATNVKLNEADLHPPSLRARLLDDD